MGIRKMRWMGSSKMCHDGKTILYLGNNEQHMFSFVIVLHKEVEKVLVGRKSIGDCMITAHFQSQHMESTVVQVYTPIEDAEETTKDVFFDHIQDTVNEIPSHDVKLLISYMNAHIENNRHSMELVIRPYGKA